MIVESTSDDIVYSSLFTGVHGNYLKGSIRNAGLDPDALPESDPSKMNFGGDATQGLEGHLGLRPGHRRGQGRGAGAGAGRPAAPPSTRTRAQRVL